MSDRMLKIYCSGPEQKAAAKQFDVVERYDGFLLARVPSTKMLELRAKFPIEDITDLYRIPTDGKPIDTSRPRLDSTGKVQSHPAYAGVKPTDAKPHHYLVQFVGPVKAAWKRLVERAGGEVRAPYADFTVVVRANGAAVKRIAALPFVRWTGHLSHGARVAPAVLERVGRQADDLSSTLPRTRVLPGVYTVQFFGSDDLAKAAPGLKRLGFNTLAREERGQVLVVEAPSGEAQRRKALTALSGVHGVRAIRERVLKRSANDVAAGVMGTTASMGSPGLGLSGAGEIVGVCDTGLDTGDPATVHPDFTNRIAFITSYPITPDYAKYINNPGANDGPADVDEGHGTHVCGSVLGSGAASAKLPAVAKPIRGLAYQAKLVFQAVEQEMKWKDPAYFKDPGRYLLAGIPNDLAVLFSQAYGKGARIHSNSWGGGDPGAYDEQCQQLDAFVWKQKDFCVVVAAGNDGTDADGDGKINAKSVTSPGTAKNCITVGACENLRTNFNAQTYGSWWPKDFPVAPIANDPMANNPDQVVAFSSRGPTKDGRTKPDVIAPGTFILSTRSTRIAANNYAWAAFPPSKMYFHMGGTSMATPLTAGAVALVREYLRKKAKIAQPTAALLKAVLIAGATRLPGTAPAGTIVDNHQGFGRVNLDAVLKPKAPLSARFSEVRPGLKSGQIYAMTVTVKAGQPLRIVLAYSDYPGPSLVNNLNLAVTDPQGLKYVGNQPKPGVPTFDARNNVEVVNVAKATAGDWKVEVIGSNVPYGPQEFAVVSIGCF